MRIGQAIHFGDFNDPKSNVSVMVRENASTRMHEELGTKPNLVYLWHQLRDKDGKPIDAAGDRPAMVPIPAKRQDNWDLRAVGNFSLGGTGSGLLTLLGLIVLAGGGAALPRLEVAIAGVPLLLDLYHLGAVMMGLGLFSVFLEINRQARFLNVFRGFRTSWMSREAVVAVLFMAVAAFKLFVVSAALSLIGSVLGAAFLYFQARILQAAKGIPAWRPPIMTWMLVFTGLFEGLGILAVAAWIGGPSLSPDIAFAVPAAGLVLAAVNAALWWRYMKVCEDRVPAQAYAVLGRHTPIIQIGGRLVPFVLFAAALAVPVGAASGLVIVAGVIAVVGGWYWKLVVIRRACHFQSFHLKSVPLRGSGIMAAPPHLTH